MNSFFGACGWESCHHRRKEKFAEKVWSIGETIQLRMLAIDIVLLILRWRYLVRDKYQCFSGFVLVIQRTPSLSGQIYSNSVEEITQEILFKYSCFCLFKCEVYISVWCVIIIMIKKKIVATNFTSMVRYTAFKCDPCHFVSLIFRSWSLYSENRLEPLKDWIR